ncbi:MAG: ABC transporter ATP-binding protein, partial [Paracoccus sp. (in: a-proteobacteria)]|nr:ABC transporter ATP-binding protein [Paracoccus sp. (in: a-proteobacteria)]
MIETRGLGVTLGGRRLLEGVELTLAPGRIIGLVGESGSGKSLTALAIIGLLPAQARVSGQVLLDGADLTALPEREMQAIRGRRIAMIFQEPMTALNPLMSIGDQVAEVLRIHHDMPRDAALDLARDRLDRVGLTAPRFGLGLFPHELSGGQRQRVAIAMAIAERPDLLIADEPTTALDVTTQAQILDLLRDLVRVEGMALLLITHDLAVVAGMADEVAVMKDGSIVEAGPTEAVFRGRTHPYTQALFAASLHRPAAPEAAPFAPHPPLLEVRGARREYRTGTRG